MVAKKKIKKNHRSNDSTYLAIGWFTDNGCFCEKCGINWPK